MTNLTVHPDAVTPSLPDGDLWVFGYGSLMWRPGFDYLERHSCQLHGYHRALCVWSHVHRGTEQQPGLVLGLARGGSCHGLAFRIGEANKQAVADYLFAREMPTAVYLAKFFNIRIAGKMRKVLSFIADTGHPQYVGQCSDEKLLAALRSAQGISGTSRDYLASSVEHLQAQGLRDKHLESLLAQL